ncbi:Protease synthase and sporulation negative regulatory protein PAI 1 [Agrobacterium sp. DSM 25558]|uniref:GNAT family N-acetyltransferase n=1 Tax=Agrobacterium sp. DSM 25558 TaxID=1907665 RepID=UPI0009725691|nr:GNAT family N-acetyltransferase [Agrobacterium sp. DSM 25558]SCX28631.1 Protease synthase and sporulation negative regulatory protein PAI 1 [Agrobacterium sp. DSM 25558]
MTEITLRAACVRDAREVAILHVAVWQQTYRDLAPENAFVTLDESYRFEKWNEKLSVPEADQLVLVAEKENRLVGIAAAGAPSEKAFGGRGEIKFLYIDPDFKRQGIGRHLLRNLATHLRDRQYPGVALSVVEGNRAATAFYEALGAEIIGRYVDPGPIWRSQNIVMAWDDFGVLIQ